MGFILFYFFKVFPIQNILILNGITHILLKISCKLGNKRYSTYFERKIQKWERCAN